MKTLAAFIAVIFLSVCICNTTEAQIKNPFKKAKQEAEKKANKEIDKGIENVYRETFDTALRIGVDALTYMGYRAFQVNRAAISFKKHNERFVREMAGHRKDRKEWISKLRQRIEDMEQIMTREMDRVGKDKDLGWDTAGLIEEFGKKAEK